MEIKTMCESIQAVKEKGLKTFCQRASQVQILSLAVWMYLMNAFPQIVGVKGSLICLSLPFTWRELSVDFPAPLEERMLFKKYIHGD